MALLNINASTFQSILPANFTLATCHAFLKQRFIDCGWGSPIAEQLGATNITVWQLAFNPSATQGQVRVALESSISASTVTLRLRCHTAGNYNSVSFTGTASTGANNTTGATFTVTTTQPLISYAIPISQQITGVCLVESPVTFKGFLGVAYPEKESWYDENSYCNVMLVQPTLVNSFWNPFPNLFSATSTTAVVNRTGLDTFSGRNPVTNVVQLVKAPYVTYHSFGIGGKFNNDLAVCNNTGFNVGDINVVTPNVEEWWNLYCGSNGIALRCV